MIDLPSLRGRLVEWLVTAAYPLWSCNGIDARTGGFVEALDLHGNAIMQPRRARVHPRQIFAFAQAQQFGWQGDAAAIIGRGMDYFTAHYRRPDGLFRALVDVDGEVLDDRALLYDQAFALLGFAAAASALNARDEYEGLALELRHMIESRLRIEDNSYLSDENSMERREANPHMHLLEAYLAWTEIGRDSGWAERSHGIIDLALCRFIRPDSGALGESYLATWERTPHVAGRTIEPGHQFEWAWLLLRCESRHPVPLRQAALRLIAVGDQYGVSNGVAVNSLYDDFTVKDASARCWPQTERLKAALLAATLTELPQYWSMARAAATSLLRYLNTSIPGLWWDEQLPNGEFRDSTAPASTFYHLVGAIGALDHALAR